MAQICMLVLIHPLLTCCRLTFQLLALFLALLFVVQLQHKAYKVFHLRLIQLQVDEMWYFIF